MADDRFGLVVHQVVRCQDGSVAAGPAQGDLRLAGSVAVCPANCGSHPDGLALVDRAPAGWHRADSVADDLVTGGSHPDDWVAVCPANCGSHPDGSVLVDRAQAGWHQADSAEVDLANCGLHPGGLVLVDPAQGGWRRADSAADGLVTGGWRPDGSLAGLGKNCWEGSGVRHCARRYGRPGAPEL